MQGLHQKRYGLHGLGDAIGFCEARWVINHMSTGKGEVCPEIGRRYRIVRDRASLEKSQLYFLLVLCVYQAEQVNAQSDANSIVVLREKGILHLRLTNVI